MDRQTIVMVREKDTKNTVRYAADPTAGPAALRTVYIERWALGDPVPDRVRVIVEADKGAT